MRLIVTVIVTASWTNPLVKYTHISRSETINISNRLRHKFLFQIRTVGTKDMNEGNGNEIVIRKERQVHPSIRLEAAINEKLHALGHNDPI